MKGSFTNRIYRLQLSNYTWFQLVECCKDQAMKKGHDRTGHVLYLEKNN